jgi:hypothetical protein
MIRKALVAILTLTGALGYAQTQLASPGSEMPVQGTIGGLPLTFELNQGQVNAQIKFFSRRAAYNTFLTGDGMMVAIRPSNVTSSAVNPGASQRVLQFKLNGSAKNPVIMGEDPQPGRVNYFIGANPAKWLTNIPTYGRVRYKNVYPGIDIVYYGSHRQLEYDFEIFPGADPSKIQFEIKGASHIELDHEHNLVVSIGKDHLTLANPKIYEVLGNQHVPVLGNYTITDSTHIGFQIEQHDATKPLVIDPVLIYSTYLGGSGDDEARAIKVDSAGNVYVGGYTDSTDFPLATLGSLPAGSPHVFVAKLDPSGSTLLYSDFIGGSNQDYGYALALDASNNVVVTGTTSSYDFPVVNAYQATYPGSSNGFLTKLSSDGSALLYSTYLGGNGVDIPSSVAVDYNNNAVIAGYTSSTNFPVSNAYQPTVSPNAGGMFGWYGFVTKFTADGSSLAYSTYFGGSSNVAYNCGGSPCWGQPSTTISSMALDSAGNVYLGGVTNTYDLPVTPGSYQSTNVTQQNALVSFVSKLGSAGNLVYSTYFYESSGLLTDIQAIAVDSGGSVYATGQAISDGTFPITTTTICDPSVYGPSCSYGFVTKFNANASMLEYSTFLGPNNLAFLSSIVLDSSNNAYVSGVTSSNSFATVNAIEPYTGGNDLFLAKLDTGGATQIWATYVGGSADENSAGLAIDSSNNLYLAGTTTSADFPFTPGAFQGVYGGNTDSVVLKIAPASSASVSLNPDSLDFAASDIGSTGSPQTVLLRNMGSAALAISSITAAGDFAESDNCGVSVQAAGNCSVSVTFSPTAAGLRNGTIQISDSAQGSPHVIALSGFANGATATFSPTSVTFPTTPVGSSSAAQSVSLSNLGNATLNVSNIQVSGDFSQVNTCGAVVAGSSCTIMVSFLPTAAGNRTGTLVVNDNAAGSFQAIPLSGTGTQAIAILSPAAVTFGPTALGTSSIVQSVTLANSGNAVLHVAAVQTTGDFSQTNTCGTVPAGASCVINIMFTPTAAGNRSGTLVVADDAFSNPQIPLAGSGSDFGLTSSPTSVAVNSGSSASYNLSISSVGGAFNNAVKLACQNVPTSASCVFSPASVTPGSTKSGSVLTISTGSIVANSGFKTRTSPRMLATWFQMGGIACLAGFFSVGRNTRRKLQIVLLLGSVLLITLLVGCAGGTGIAPQGHGGTTSGTYTITVIGSSGTLQHSVSLTLAVR